MKSITIKTTKQLLKLCSLGFLMTLSACSTASNMMNPFYEEPSAEAQLGVRNDHALNGSERKDDTARNALEAMAKYQATHYPQPMNPVVQPAVVRLMWIPDRLNRNGDLVPSHYYYLKVLQDRWAVQDAFELEAQLNGPKGASAAGGASSNVPYVNAEDRIN